MPLIIHQIKCPFTESTEYAKKKAIRSVGLDDGSVKSIDVYKRSLDARCGREVSNVYSFVIELYDKKAEIAVAKRFGLPAYNDVDFDYKAVLPKDKKIVIAGFGPAGMFASLALAREGYRPLVLERGAKMEDRIKAVNEFWSGGELNEDSNVQFGEGGAGTFSDGKLTTRIKDPLCRVVLKELVHFGADREILTLAKPHIGTDKIRDIAVRIRKEIESLGGGILFDSPLDGLRIKNGSISGVYSKGREIKADKLILSIGHSARDTFEMLIKSGVVVEPKPFSVGARIEHRQCDVEQSLYGALAGDKRLPAGEYQLSHRFSDGSAVYTFCMCPGGYVVAAQSDQNSVITNGMSFSTRDGKNANAALVVSVTPEDYGRGALDGVKFAENLEKKAYELTGGYKAPCMSVKGFVNNDVSIKSYIEPTYSRGVEYSDFSKLFSQKIIDKMKIGIGCFSKKMHCFSDGLLTAPETRTSSPVRIVRKDDMSAVGIDNLYPAGEGAGYAGGIMSAAVDGIKAAVKIMQYSK